MFKKITLFCFMCILFVPCIISLSACNSTPTKIIGIGVEYLNNSFELNQENNTISIPYATEFTEDDLSFKVVTIYEDGTRKTLDYKTDLNEGYTLDYSSIPFNEHDFIPVGEYPITFMYKNFTHEITLIITTFSLAIPTLTQYNFTYNEQEVDITNYIQNFDDELMYIDEEYSFNVSKATNVGDYAIYIKLKSDNYHWSSDFNGIIYWSIKHNFIPSPSLSISNLEYTGEEINVENLINNFDDSVMEINQEQSILSASEIGQYKIVIDLKNDNYAFNYDKNKQNITINWSITKKIVPIPYLTQTQYVYTGGTPQLKFENFNNELMTYTLTGIDYREPAYTFQVFIKEEYQELYTWSNPSYLSNQPIHLQYNITQAKYILPTEIEGPSNSKIFIESVYLENKRLGSITLEKSSFTETTQNYFDNLTSNKLFTNPNYSLAWKTPTDILGDVGQYSKIVIYKHSGENYAPVEFVVNIEVVQQSLDMSQVTWDNEKIFVYDGSAKSMTLLNVPTEVYLTTQDYAFIDNVWTMLEDNQSIVDAGKYKTIATISSVNYKLENWNIDVHNNALEYSTECYWEINKANEPLQNLSWPNDNIYIYDQTAKQHILFGTEFATVFYQFQKWNGETWENIDTEIVDTGRYKTIATILSKNYTFESPILNLDESNNFYTAEQEWEITLKNIDMSNVLWQTEVNFVYDAQPHNVSLTNIPSAISISYQYQKYDVKSSSWIDINIEDIINVGSYKTIATIEPNNSDLINWSISYTQIDNHFVSECAFQITKSTLDVTSITWDNSNSFTYNGNKHNYTLINVPNDVIVSYSYQQYQNEMWVNVDNEQDITDVGRYKTIAYISSENCKLENWSISKTDVDDYYKAEHEWIINKAIVSLDTLAWQENTQIIYDGYAKTFTLINAENLTVSYKNFKYDNENQKYIELTTDIFDAGKYKTIATIEARNFTYISSILTISQDSNYYTSEQQWEIKKQHIEIGPQNWSISSVTYNGAYISPTLVTIDDTIAVLYTTYIFDSNSQTYILTTEASNVGTYKTEATLTNHLYVYTINGVPIENNTLILNWEIEPLVINANELIWNYSSPYTYNKQIQYPTITNLPSLQNVQINPNYLIINTFNEQEILPIDVGSYNISVSSWGTFDENNITISGDVSLNFSIDYYKVSSTDFSFNYSTNQPFVHDNLPKTLTLSSAFLNENDYTAEFSANYDSPTQTDAGNYTSQVTITLNNGNCIFENNFNGVIILHWAIRDSVFTSINILNNNQTDAITYKLQEFLNLTFIEFGSTLTFGMKEDYSLRIYYRENLSDEDALIDINEGLATFNVSKSLIDVSSLRIVVYNNYNDVVFNNAYNLTLFNNIQIDSLVYELEEQGQVLNHMLQIDQTSLNISFNNLYLQNYSNQLFLSINYHEPTLLTNNSLSIYTDNLTTISLLFSADGENFENIALINIFEHSYINEVSYQLYNVVTQSLAQDYQVAKRENTQIPYTISANNSIITSFKISLSSESYTYTLYENDKQTALDLTHIRSRIIYICIIEKSTSKIVESVQLYLIYNLNLYIVNQDDNIAAFEQEKYYIQTSTNEFEIEFREYSDEQNFISSSSNININNTNSNVISITTDNYTPYIFPLIITFNYNNIEYQRNTYLVVNYTIDPANYINLEQTYLSYNGNNYYSYRSVFNIGINSSHVKNIVGHTDYINIATQNNYSLSSKNILISNNVCIIKIVVYEIANPSVSYSINLVISCDGTIDANVNISAIEYNIANLDIITHNLNDVNDGETYTLSNFNSHKGIQILAENQNTTLNILDNTKTNLISKNGSLTYTFTQSGTYILEIFSTSMFKKSITLLVEGDFKPLFETLYNNNVLTLNLNSNGTPITNMYVEKNDSGIPTKIIGYVGNILSTDLEKTHITFNISTTIPSCITDINGNTFNDLSNVSLEVLQDIEGKYTNIVNQDYVALNVNIYINRNLVSFPLYIVFTNKIPTFITTYNDNEVMLDISNTGYISGNMEVRLSKADESCQIFAFLGNINIYDSELETITLSIQTNDANSIKDQFKNDIINLNQVVLNILNDIDGSITGVENTKYLMLYLYSDTLTENFSYSPIYLIFANKIS